MYPSRTCNRHRPLVQNGERGGGELSRSSPRSWMQFVQVQVGTDQTVPLTLVRSCGQGPLRVNDRRHGRGLVELCQGRWRPGCGRRFRPGDRLDPNAAGEVRGRRRRCGFCARTKLLIDPGDPQGSFRWIVLAEKPMNGRKQCGSFGGSPERCKRRQKWLSNQPAPVLPRQKLPSREVSE